MNFRQKIRYASRLETASVIKIVMENGRVRYGTVLGINSDPLLYFRPNNLFKIKVIDFLI